MAGTLLRLYLLMDVDVADNQKREDFYGKQWYEGLVKARNNLQTALRRQMRLMEPRGLYTILQYNQTNRPKALK